MNGDKKNIVLIPTYNECENIEAIIHAVMELDGDFHILVIDDGSPDGTANIVKGLQSKFTERLHLLERKGKLGLGTAYITGFKWALERDYGYIFEMDADFSHNPKDLVRMAEQIRKQTSGVVIGSRYVTGVNVVNWPIERIIMSYYRAYIGVIAVGELPPEYKRVAFDASEFEGL